MAADKEQQKEEKKTEKTRQEVEKQNEMPADPNEPLNRVPSPTNPNVDPKTKPGPTEGPDKPGVNPTPDRTEPGQKASANVAADPRITAMQAELAAARAEAGEARKIAAEERDKRVAAEYAKIAEKAYPNLPGTAEEKGRALMAMETKLGSEEAKTLKTVLAAGDSAMALLMREKGSSQPGAGSAEAELEKLGAQLAKEKNITAAQGVRMAIQQNPELYKRSISERGN